ncbi:hypothetical protein D3C78_1894030 [compost metagenome]
MVRAGLGRINLNSIKRYERKPSIAVASSEAENEMISRSVGRLMCSLAETAIIGYSGKCQMYKL